jgi:DNA-binding IscR family transcriptional regulator
MSTQAGTSLDDEFWLEGIAEEDARIADEDRSEREARAAVRALLLTAKARLHAYLKTMTLEELLDRLFRQTPALNDVRQRSEAILAKRVRKAASVAKKAA